MAIKKINLIVALLGCWLILSGWGYKGHEVIGKKAALSFNDEMAQFESWVEILANHSGDADKRKSWDQTEGIKHYIDIDNFPEFKESGKIAQDINELIETHGREFISDQGILPWATLRTFDTLVVCFQNKDFDKAALIAADLSHYVGDGHMPLHITANYDGQLSGNKGIHSRYESTMINKNVDELVYDGGAVSFIENASDYVFNYIYESNGYCDSILNADTYAQNVTTSQTSAAYSDSLWLMTKKLTIDQFQKSSFALAELIYSAWVKAGSPSFDDHTFSKDLVAFKTMLNAVYYSDSVLNVEFALNDAADISCEVFTLGGDKVTSSEIGHYQHGLHHFQVPLGITKGIYLLTLRFNGKQETQKFSVR